MSQDFFQCLLCKTFFGNLWKVEKHIKQHENDDLDEQSRRAENGGVGRRRGMMPIKRVTFHDCFIPVVKNQIDPVFLQQYSEVQAKEEVDDNVASDCSALEYYGDFDDIPSSGDEKIESAKAKSRKGRKSKLLPLLPVLETEKRKPRKCQLKAITNIRRAAAVLKVPDQQDVMNEHDGDMDYMEELLKELPDQDEDAEFIPPSYVNKKNTTEKRKAGRTVGRVGKRKPTLKAKSQRKKKAAKGLKEFFECEYCSESFSIRGDLYMHFHKDHVDQKTMLTCPILPCSKPYPNFISLRTHFRQHNEAEHREHTLLNKVVDGTSSTNTQNNTDRTDPDFENLDVPVPCKFCLQKFESVKLLQKHSMKDHNDSFTLKCPCCGKDDFENRVVLFIGHLKTIHSNFLDPFNERAKERDKYREKEKRFKCEKCSSAFHFNHQYKQHLQYHERVDKKKLEEEEDDVRRFVCPVCKKKFKYKDNLRRHFTLHLENNPFVCDFPGCNRKFNSDYNLRRHRSLHSESASAAQRVSCSLCGASFSRKDKLPKHLREVHKPSDIDATNADCIQRQKKFNYRLPHCTRVPKFLTYKDLGIKKDIHENVVASTAETGIVKVEASESAAPEEEIHLTDRIILGSDESAVHIKGEQITPEKVSRFLSMKPLNLQNKDNSSASEIPVTDSPAPAIQMTSLTKLITSDPVFEKLAKEDPSIIKDVVAKTYNYKLKKTFDCHICEAVFSRAWTLQLHLKTQHNQTIMDQKQAGANGEADANEHQVTLMCGTCAYPAKDAKDLAKHTKLSHKPKIVCKKCGLYFDGQRRLHIHMRQIHDGVRNFKCRFCSKTFTNQNYARGHERKVHENSNQPRVMRKCPVENCHAVVAPSTYYKHLKQHEYSESVMSALQMEKIHKCMLCGDILCTTHALRRHIDAVHLGKPINKGRKRTGLKGENTTVPRKATIRRGPKAVGDEWFLPLLEKAGITTRAEEDQNNDNSSETRNGPDESKTNDGENGNNDELMSILGF